MLQKVDLRSVEMKVKTGKGSLGKMGYCIGSTVSYMAARISFASLLFFTSLFFLFLNSYLWP